MNEKTSPVEETKAEKAKRAKAEKKAAYDALPKAFYRGKEMTCEEMQKAGVDKGFISDCFDTEY